MCGGERLRGCQSSVERSISENLLCGEVEAAAEEGEKGYLKHRRGK